MIKSFLKTQLAKFGFEVRRRSTTESELFRAGLNAYRDQPALFRVKEPETIFDIGAHHGQTTAKYRQLFPCAHIFTFEPFPPSFERVVETFKHDALVSTFMLAAADINGEQEFYSNRAEYTNSLLSGDKRAVDWVPERTTRNIERISVSTCTLDKFCEQQNVQHIHILKTDVQGAELRLLQGANRFLAERRVDVLYLEVLFAPLYEGQTDFCELMGYLSSAGYRLIGIYNINRGTNGLAAWGDALFVRNDFPMPETFRERHVAA